MKITPSRSNRLQAGRLKRKIRLAQFALAALASCTTLVYGAGSTLVFDAPASFDLGGGGVGNRIAVADFNRDGNPDLAVTPDVNAAEAFPNLDGVNILFGDGQGSFPDNASFVAGEYLTDMAVADFNGDGILDVATTQSFMKGFGFGFFCNSAVPRVPVLLGSAAGAFTLQTPCLSAGHLPGAIAAADFDEDGKLDLLVTVSLNDVNTIDVTTQFLSGNGNGTFAPARQFNTQKADRAVVADFNRDGHLDVAMAGGSYVYHGTGRGTLVRGQRIGLPGWRDIAVGDINADGIPDLAGVGSNIYSPGDDVVSVVLGQPDGSFVALGSPLATGANPALESHPTAVAIADMNGDGYGDVIVLNNQSDDVAVFLRNPAGTFHPRQIFSTRALTARGTTNTAPRGLAVADWNKDGYPDIVVSNQNPTIDGTPDDGTVTVLIQQAIARPSATDDAAATLENTTVTVQVWSNDSDSLGALAIGTVAVVGGPSHGTAAANGDGTITYMPAPNFAGFDSFTYTIKNTSGVVSNLATVAVMVKRANRLPLAVDDRVSALTNAAVVIPVLANDFDPEGALVPSTVTLQTLPASGTASVDAVTGTVAYTPSAAGSYSFTYTVQDAGGATSNIATVTVSVTRANAPPLALDDSATTSPGTPVAIPVLANDSDPDGDVIDRTKIAIVAVPAHGGLTVSTTTGAITYTPAAGYSGPDSFAYTVKDIRGATSNPATVSITVGGGNQAPVANNGSLALTEDVAGGGTLSATDPEGNALTFSIVTNGTKGRATITNAATGAYTYTPNVNANGTDSFTFRASDGSLNSNLATVSVAIAAVNDAPAPTAAAIAVNEDTAATRQVAPNDPDAGNTHTYSVVGAPTHGTASVSASGLVSYTPAANYTGPDSLVVRVTDQGGAFGQVTIAVTVAAVNDAPVAANDAAATPQGTAVTVNVLANDSDADGTLNPATVALGTLPASGSASVNPTTGAITYTPATGFSGPVSFTYTVKDNGGASSNAATVTINVTAVNQPPVASNGALPVTEDAAASGTLSATDPEGNALTFSIVTNGTKGRATITNAATGAYTYTPNVNANGTDSFTFRASDGSLNSNLATVSVAIAAVNDAPAPTAAAIAVNEDTAATRQVAPNDPDAGNTHSYSIVTAPLHGTASVSAAGLVSYTPAANYTGPDSLVVRVTDQGGAFGQVTIAVTVAAVNDAPVAVNDAAATPQGTAVTVRVLANDSDADGTLNPATVALGTLPASGSASVNPTTGAITYTPATGFSGPASFTYTVKDNGGASSNAATVTINVTAVAGRVPGDLDGDRDVDKDDITILLANINLPTSSSKCGTACDLDGDGIITLLDMRKLQSICTREGCTVQ